MSGLKLSRLTWIVGSVLAVVTAGALAPDWSATANRSSPSFQPAPEHYRPAGARLDDPRPAPALVERVRADQEYLASLLAQIPSPAAVVPAPTGPPVQARPGQTGPPAPAGPALNTPFSAVPLGLQDVAALSTTINPFYVRYLSLYNIPAERRALFIRLANFAVNSVSRETMTPIAVVPQSNGTLVRVNLLDYGISPEAWDKLARLGSGRAPLPEPYFNQLYEKQTPVVKTAYVQNSDGSWKWDYQKNDWATTTVQEVKKTKFRDTASWLRLDTNKPIGQQKVDALMALTNTRYPVVRADWFIVYALWAPRYYDLLGLGKTAQDFEKLALFDDKNANKVKLAGVVVNNTANPQVAINNRFIIRTPTISGVFAGYIWETNDSKRSTDERAYMNNLLDFAKVELGFRPRKGKQKFFDATESICQLRNGLQGYFLTDGLGQRLDKADADVAQDSTTRLTDKQVWAGRNRIGCHLEGIRPFREDVRNLARTNLLREAQIKLHVVDDDSYGTNSRIIKQLFSTDLTQIIQFDQALYQTAVQAATGMPATEAITAFNDVTWEYLDKPLDLEDVAREVGMPAAQVRAALEKGKGLDYTLTGLLDDPPAPIRRDNWENNAFPQLMVYLAPFRSRNRLGASLMQKWTYGLAGTAVAIFLLSFWITPGQTVWAQFRNQGYVTTYQTPVAVAPVTVVTTPISVAATSFQFYPGSGTGGTLSEQRVNQLVDARVAAQLAQLVKTQTGAASGTSSLPAAPPLDGEPPTDEPPTTVANLPVAGDYLKTLDTYCARCHTGESSSKGFVIFRQRNVLADLGRKDKAIIAVFADYAAMPPAAKKNRQSPHAVPRAAVAILVNEVVKIKP